MSAVTLLRIKYDMYIRQELQMPMAAVGRKDYLGWRIRGSRYRVTALHNAAIAADASPFPRACGTVNAEIYKVCSELKSRSKG